MAVRNTPARRGMRPDDQIAPRPDDKTVKTMTQRKRKLIGAIALMVLVALYALLALAAAIVLQVHQANKLVELLYYLIAGLLWVIPAGAIIAWMQKPDLPAQQDRP